MNLLQLERIVMVAKSGNITDVAKKLYISQPALSQTIAIVEEEVGATLFDRRAQPIKLTPEGECFLRAAREILRTNQAMMQEIHTVRSGARGRIAIGTSIPRCRSVWSHILPEMMAQYPHVTLSFVDGKSVDFERMISLGNVNFALSNYPPNSNRVASHLLNEERFFLVANRRSSFAQKMDESRLKSGDLSAPISLKEATDERFILLNPQRNSRIAFNQMVREAGITPHVAIEAYNSDIALEYVEANLGVALLAAVKQNETPFRYQTETLSYYTLDSKYSVRDLYLFYDADSPLTYAQQYLMDLVLSHFAPLSTQSSNTLG